MNHEDTKTRRKKEAAAPQHVAAPFLSSLLRAFVSSWLPLLFLVQTAPAHAQLAPEVGYINRSGGQVGTTTEVVIGGYDWTPDMQVFVHDPRIQITLEGPPSPVLVPDPPYWFGAKGRGPAWPLPREFKAKLTIAPDVPPGLYRWQVANANGISPPATFHVGAFPEVADTTAHQSPLPLPALPVTICGQIQRIEEIDRYVITPTRAGPITIDLVARQLGSPLHAMIQVTTAQGRRLLDVADTEGRDGRWTFPAVASEPCTLSLHDLDFAGDRSYAYRLSLVEGPQILAARPAAGKRGETRTIEFLGSGLQTGGPQLESITREVAFPADLQLTDFEYRLETPAGVAWPHRFPLSNLDELSEPPAAAPRVIPAPSAVTGALATRFEIDEYTVDLTPGQRWTVTALPTSPSCPLDLELTVLDPAGQILATQDDQTGSTTPQLTFAAASAGPHRLRVSDLSGKSGRPDAAYRLTISAEQPDVLAAIPDRLTVPLGGKAPLVLKATRTGGFTGPIRFALTDLPEGITVPAEAIIPADKAEVSVELTSAPDGPVTAALANVAISFDLAGAQVTRPVGPMLIAATMKPRIKITPEGLDDVRKIHRGSTFLAPLLIERLEDFDGDITLEMTSKQQRHRQGLASDEFTVKPGEKRVEYPIFVPEWMETTKTSRMIVNGAVKVADPKGTIRTLLQRQELRIGLLPEGSLMKLTHATRELDAPAAGTLTLKLTLSRAPGFILPAEIELVPTTRGVTAANQQAAPNAESLEFPLELRQLSPGDYPITIRATAVKDGWPVRSEVHIMLVVK
jgi:hypothetical protein